MKCIVLFFLIVSIACETTSLESEAAAKNQRITTDIESTVVAHVRQGNIIRNQTERDEKVPDTFVDELNIGKPKFNRVEVSTYQQDEKIFVKTRFFAKSESRWILKNEFDIEKSGGLPIQPKMMDLNGDGYNDITLVSKSPARGANEVRDLMIFNPRKGELIHIENSNDFPNLEYNPLLKGLTSWHFTGSTTTVFLKIKGNNLFEIASIDDRGTERTVTVIDQNSGKKVLRREKRIDDGFDRYINFNPVQKSSE